MNTRIPALLLLLLLPGSLLFAQDNKQNDSLHHEARPADNIVSFYLLGDTGHDAEKANGTLKNLDRYLEQKATASLENDFLLFLGDNITETGDFFSVGEFPGIENFPGQILFLPGELEWENGVAGLKETSELLQTKFDREEVFLPTPGCAFSFVDISDDVHLIILDSQWFLSDWNKTPLVNSECPEIISREAMFSEVESELKKNQEKTTIIAVHHPLRSGGVHGGYNGWSSYLRPSEKEIPVPVVGQVANLLRTSGGTSIQDAGNPQYQAFTSRLRTLGKKWGKVIFASGHEHILQYLEDEVSKQVVAGAGSVVSYGKDGKYGEFTAEEQGFAVLNVKDNGASQLIFVGNGGEELLAREIYPKDEEFDLSTLPKSFPATETASIYSEEETTKTGFYKNLWGERYRDLYSTEVKVPVAFLDTLYGGLEVVRAGGGNQTNSIRLRDTLDREYNIRMLRKDAVQFLQNAAFKSTPVQEAFEDSYAEEMIMDFYTASHPYGYMAVPILADAGGILHTNPEVYYLPKQPALGDYNSEHGNELYMIEERPEENWVGAPRFGSPNEDLESTAGLFERLRRDEKYSLDEASYIRARVFDMLIGDWDRHADQWRWAETELENGNHIFRALPRDRDQAFSNFDGWVFRNFKKFIGFFNQFGDYGPDIKNVKWFNRAAANLDRYLPQNSGKQDWLQEAEFLQKNITDDVIEKAFRDLPVEFQGESAQRIKEELKARRSNLTDIISRYYEHISELGVMTGTDKDDIIEITRLAGGDTRVSIFRKKDGEKAELVNERTYVEDETEQVWVYGLDDDDKFIVQGDHKSEIRIELIGGQDHDTYDIQQGKRVKIYDHRSQELTVEAKNGAKIFRTDNYEINTFNSALKIFNQSMIVPSLGYNPDDGLMLGAQAAFTTNNLVRKPFTTQHLFRARYLFGTGGFDLAYSGEFARPGNRYNFLAGAHYSSNNFTNNFFGIGNETEYDPDNVTKSYNRVRVSNIGANLGLVRRGKYGSTFKFSALFEGVRVEDTPDRFLTDFYPEEASLFDRHYYTGLQGMYTYESYDDALNPARGLNFRLTAGGKMNVKETENYFGYLKPYLEFYTPLSRNEKWVLNPRVQAQLNFNDDFQFYHAATLGGSTGLRSFRQQRFTGKQAFAAGTDLRYSFDESQGGFLPFQLGIYGGYDLGRVWVKNEDSDLWHESYGGGFWISIAKAAAADFSLFHGEEGFRFAFGFNFGF